jgi:predicted N-acyltransferase
VSATNLRVHHAIDEVPREAWDALVEDDPEATPFTRWAFLEALERSGCVQPAASWRPRHLTLWRRGRLVAAAPAYAKDSSDGDFSRDWGFAEGARRAGIRFYPKLLITVPFTPVTGRRLLVAASEDRGAAVAALVEGALGLARDERLSGLQVLFPTPPEAREIEALGLARRVDVQYHWFNRGYVDVGAWLATLDSKRRHQARRERAAPAAQGITIRTVRGEALAREAARWGHDVYGFYRANIDKLMWGRPWLNEAFYRRIFATMPEHLEVVAATREGRLVGGAFNVSTATRLYGRYWGCHEEHPFLHFNVCLYHSIEDCIERRIPVFEGGAGGEHKRSRGFALAPTSSAHAYFDRRLDEGIREYLRAETAAREQELAAPKEAGVMRARGGERQ